MARRKYRKKRISKAAQEVWGRYACPRTILFNFDLGMMRVISHYRDEHYIRREALRGVAANSHITVDELKAALAPKLLVDKLDKATGV